MHLLLLLVRFRSTQSIEICKPESVLGCSDAAETLGVGSVARITSAVAKKGNFSLCLASEHSREMLDSARFSLRTRWTRLLTQSRQPFSFETSAAAADAHNISRTVRHCSSEQYKTSSAFKLAYPRLRCLHLSETPVTRLRTSLPNREKYRVPLTWASAGFTEQHSIAGTGEDIFYSIWQEGEFPRLEELTHTDHYQYAYMFNVPCAYRHTGHVRDKVLVFRSGKNFVKTNKALGAGIFWLYAGYEMDGCAGCDYHLSSGYGLVWNKAVITDWTLVARRKPDHGSNWAIL